MASVAEALRQHAAKFLERLATPGTAATETAGTGTAYKTRVAIRKVFAAIMRCRTGQLGGVHWECTGCGRSHWVGRSCGNRHCPTCGHEKTHTWLEKQSHKLLTGVHHFLVTFTVAQELREVLRVHQRAYAYLLDVMGRIKGAGPKELEALLPDRWIQSHPEAYMEERAVESHAAKHRKRMRRIARRAKLAAG